MPVPPVNVVCLGSSAGGLAALKEFFTRMAPDSGRAFVVIQHLQADGPTLTRDILARITTMVVVTAQDRLSVLPNHVYTIAPGTQLIIANGQLGVTPRTETGARHHPFDRFLKSLATDCGAEATAVVFSGYDGDGSEGFVAIKAHGGITYAQDGTATVGEMPASAMATGSVDHVLNAGQIADHLSHPRDLREPSATPAGTAKRRPPDLEDPRKRGADP
jgi:two-component system, chemotaxis family, CheB/CheR fusion protein